MIMVVTTKWAVTGSQVTEPVHFMWHMWHSIKTCGLKIIMSDIVVDLRSALQKPTQCSHPWELIFHFYMKYL